jgi:hypothetical protein
MPDMSYFMPLYSPVRRRRSNMSYLVRFALPALHARYAQLSSHMPYAPLLTISAPTYPKCPTLTQIAPVCGRVPDIWRYARLPKM